MATRTYSKSPGTGVGIATLNTATASSRTPAAYTKLSSGLTATEIAPSSPSTPPTTSCFFLQKGEGAGRRVPGERRNRVVAASDGVEVLAIRTDCQRFDQEQSVDPSNAIPLDLHEGKGAAC
jgi:hypothetical protein